MSKFMNIPRGGKREKTIVKLKLVVEMLLLPGSKKGHDVDAGADSSSSGGVPADVKEGHFAVIAATEEGEVKRFVVPLTYLEYPPFMRLLKEAEEEYGFDHHNGALTLPCHPNELESMLLSSSQQQTLRRRRASGSFMLNRMTNWVDLST